MTTTFTVSIILLLVTLVNCNSQDNITKSLNSSQSWGYGILAGFCLSLIGFITAILLVCCKNKASDGCFEIIIKFFFTLACGALIGDSTIHILSEAYVSADPQLVSLIFILAILTFVIIDRMFHHFGISHNHWHSQKCHDDHQGAIGKHDHPRKIQNIQIEDIQQHQGHPSNKINQNLNRSSSVISNSKQSNKIIPANSDSQVQEQKKEKTCLQNLKGKGSAGYMNIIGSFIHNFMDGLATGVAFGTGDSSQYIPVVIAIVAHQIPRQMGDVAILLTNKFNGTQTILCNGFVNFISVLGVIIGLAATSLSQLTQTYIMVFVAGNFIYIAADIWRNIFKNNSFLKNLLQLFGFSIGIGLMYLVLYVQQGQI